MWASRHRRLTHHKLRATSQITLAIGRNTLFASPCLTPDQTDADASKQSSNRMHGRAQARALACTAATTKKKKEKGCASPREALIGLLGDFNADDMDDNEAHLMRDIKTLILKSPGHTSLCQRLLDLLRCQAADKQEDEQVEA